MDVSKSRIPVAGPWITDREIDYVRDAVATAWYDDAGRYPRRFEEAFAARMDRVFAVSLPSCTSGLHLALRAAGVGPGDEVIVADATWIASAAPISYVGATPVFADVDPATWCLSPDTVAAALTPRTKAVIAVDLYGNMPDLVGLERMAAARGFALVEDAAEAVGSSLDGRPAGNFGQASVFSFHGSKTLTTGEGGMLLTDDPAFHRTVLRLRDHGREPGDVMFRNIEVGFKYRMSALQAALGLAQLERLDELVTRKREIFDWYRDGLGEGAPLVLNPPIPGCHNSYWMVTAILDPGLALDKETVIAALKAQGVDCRPFFYPLSSLKAYTDSPDQARAAANNATAYTLSRLGLNLPSALCLRRKDVARVCDILLRILKR